MKLLVDVGNTRLKWCLASQPEKVTAVPSEQWHPVLGSWQTLGLSNIVVASVKASQWCQDFSDRCEQHLGVVPEFIRVDPGWKGLSLRYSPIHSLGVDRWLAMLAAQATYPQQNVIAIGAGSAWTADYVSAEGAHLGGLIVPGVSFSYTSLGRQTDQVGYHAGAISPNWVPGNATLQCVHQGVSALYRGFIREACIEQSVLRSPVNLLVGGGDAEQVALVLRDLGADVRMALKPDSVLQGLAVYSSINKDKAKM